jgi:hypothetical protein
MSSASWDRKRFAIIALGFAFLYAYLAEAVFGVADITGSFIAASLFLTPLGSPMWPPVAIFSPICSSPRSSSQGSALKSLYPSLQVKSDFYHSVILLAVDNKVVGCGLGARLCHYSKKDSLRIGVGMCSRASRLDCSQQRHCHRTYESRLYGPQSFLWSRLLPLPPPSSSAWSIRKDTTPSTRSWAQRFGRQLRGVSDFDAASQKMLDPQRTPGKGQKRKKTLIPSPPRRRTPGAMRRGPSRTLW